MTQVAHHRKLVSVGALILGLSLAGLTIGAMPRSPHALPTAVRNVARADTDADTQVGDTGGSASHDVHGDVVSTAAHDADKPDNADKPDAADKPDNAAQRPHNHGWFVTQVAQDHTTTGRAHGEAVSKEAKSSDGK